MKPLSEQALRFFSDHAWSGNVRELENMVHRYVVLGKEEAMIEEFAPSVTPAQTIGEKKVFLPERDRRSLREIQQEAVLRAECELISKVLDRTNWNRKKSAELLNISYKALLYKIKGYGIQKRSASLFLLVLLILPLFS